MFLSLFYIIVYIYYTGDPFLERKYKKLDWLTGEKLRAIYFSQTFFVNENKTAASGDILQIINLIKGFNFWCILFGEEILN